MHDKKIALLDSVSLALLGALCFLFSMFGRDFAKIHITLPFLDFPIFIGEIILAILLTLLFIKRRLIKVKFHTFNYLVLVFALFVIIKATILGYLKWGPLAFRNAAMFYYILFAVAAFYFYNRRVFNKKLLVISLLFFLIIICFLYMPRHYSFYTYFALILVLSSKTENKIIKILGYVLAAYFIIRYCLLRSGPKGYVISGTLAFLFLMGTIIYIFNKNRLKPKLIISLLFILTFTVFLVLFINKDIRKRVNTLISFNDIIKAYKTHIAYLDLPDPTSKVETYRYVQYPEKVKLYEETSPLKARDIKESGKLLAKGKTENNSNLIKKPISDSGIEYHIQQLDITLSKTKSQITTSDPKVEIEAKDLKEAIEILSKIEPEVKEIISDKFDKVKAEARGREIQEIKRLSEKLIAEKKEDEATIKLNNDNLPHIQEILRLSNRIVEEIKIAQNKRVVSYPEIIPYDRDLNTTLWRLFLWRDIFQELIKSKAFLGIDFGKPLRSPTMERLRYVEGTGWSLAEWVGWLEPHNSYLHILYRAGIIGLVFIIIIWSIFFSMTHFFIRKSSFIGIVLCSALLYYLLISNFIVFLELPQFSIPFWSLFGLTYAYYKQGIENETLDF